MTKDDIMEDQPFHQAPTMTTMNDIQSLQKDQTMKSLGTTLAMVHNKIEADPDLDAQEEMLKAIINRLNTTQIEQTKIESTPSMLFDRVVNKSNANDDETMTTPPDES